MKTPHKIELTRDISPDWTGTCSADIRAAIDAAPEGSDGIQMLVNSRGGDVLEGMGIHNAIKSSKLPVHAKILAYCASMGTVATCAAKTVSMPKNGFFVVHEPFPANGKETDNVVAVKGMMRDMIADIYAAKTGKPAADMLALMKAETWMNGTQAKAAGFVDEVEDETEMTACIPAEDAKRFAKMPEEAKKLVIQPVDAIAVLRAELETAYSAKLADNAKAAAAQLSQAVTDAVTAKEKALTELHAKATVDMQAKLTELTAIAAKVTDAETKLAAAATATATAEAKISELTAGLKVTGDQTATEAATPTTWRAALLTVQEDHPDCDAGKVWD